MEYIEKRNRKGSVDMVAVEVDTLLKTVIKPKWVRRSFGGLNWISR
jgi:hypothetical protein